MAGRGHLVVVVPGIGGSVLARPGRCEDVVWDAGKGDIADLVVRPDRMSVAESPRLEPIGLTASTKFLGFTVVPGYEGLLEQLESFGSIDRRGDPRRPRRDADVVVVPYDFRRGIVEAADRLDAVVRARLDGLSEAARAGRVIVVAHSMGGLVARYWLGPLGRWGWCRALITVGTPHRGASKALDWLVNGVRLCGVRLGGPSGLVWDWPAVAQLLPRYPAVRNLTVPADAPNARYPHELPIAGLTAASDAPDATWYPHELPIDGLTVPADAPDMAWYPHELPIAGLTAAPDATWYPHELPVDGLAGPAKAAYDLHVEIEGSWRAMPRGGPEMVACMGWSHPTPDACFWDGVSLRVTKQPPDWLDLAGRWMGDFGDGTVPAYSALPPELDNQVRGRIRLLDRHVPMACSTRILELIMDYEGWPPPTLVRGDERSPAIGLDVEELHASGQPIPVIVTVREVDADLSGQAMWAQLRPQVVDVAAGMAGRVSVQLDWDSERGCFSGALPGQPEGLYELEVSAREVPQAGDLAVVDTVAVVDGD